MDQSSILRYPAKMLRRLQQLMGRLQSILGPMLSAPNRLLKIDREKPPVASNKRQHPRVALRNTTVHVTDGCLFATALLENISPTGLCLCNLPEQLYKNSGTLTVFSSDNPGLPVLQIEPRWQKSDRGGKTIGAVILNATDAWRLFFVHTAGRLSL